MPTTTVQNFPVVTTPRRAKRVYKFQNKPGRPLKYTDPESMAKLVDEFFVFCDEHDKPYTITGLALALDMTREQLLEYQERPDFTDTIKKAKQRCAAYAEEQLFKQGGQVAGIIFAMKNNFGWKDEVETRNKNIDMNDLLDRIERQTRPNEL